MGSGKKWVGASTLLSTLSVRMILTENGKKLIVVTPGWQSRNNMVILFQQHSQAPFSSLLYACPHILWSKMAASLL